MSHEEYINLLDVYYSLVRYVANPRQRLRNNNALFGRYAYANIIDRAIYKINDCDSDPSVGKGYHMFEYEYKGYKYTNNQADMLN